MKRILAVIIFAAAISCVAQDAQVRIDINGISGKTQLTPDKYEQGLNVCNPDWAGANKAYYLSVTSEKIDNAWTPYEFSFLPETDGEVRLTLMGPYTTDAKNMIWMAYDNLIVTGAEIINPDFENIEQGSPKGWSCYSTSVLKEQKDAQSGKNYAKATCVQTVWQSLKVKKGQTVTVKFYIKAVEDKK